MKFKFVHNNINVFDLDRSLDFYRKALDLKEVRRKEASVSYLAAISME